MDWWLWVVGGLVLAAIELATPGGFFILFFGISGVLVGLLARTGLAEPLWLQWLLFPLIATAALRLFRRPLLAKLSAGDSPRLDTLVGELAVTTTEMQAGQHGRVELRGTTWAAHNVGAPVAAGARMRVVAVHGLTLDVRSE